MIKIKDIEKYIEDEMLDTIFREREEQLYQQKEVENTEINKIKEEYSTDYEKLLTAVKNIPPHFNNTRERILKTLDEYITRENLLMAYDNEVFYKSRFLRWH